MKQNKSDFIELSTSPEDLSYDAFIKRIQNNSNNGYYDPSQKEISISSWVPDNDASHCKLCRKAFSFLRRRHHCRVCGRIFCYECSSKKAILPRNIQSFPRSPQTSDWKSYLMSLYFNKKKLSDILPERVCDPCEKRVRQINGLESLIIIFSRVLVPDLANLSSVSKNCRQVANIHQFIIRDIQYKLPIHQFDQNEKRILKRNSLCFAGHNHYLTQILRITDWSNPDEAEKSIGYLSKKREYPCKIILCGKSCYENLTAEDAIGLIYSRIPNLDLRKKLIHQISLTSDSVFECFIPILIWDLMSEIGSNNNMMDLLVEKSISNSKIRTSIYWGLNVYRKINEKFNFFYNQYMYRINQELGKEVVWNELIQGRKLVKIFESMPNTSTHRESEIKQYFKEKLVQKSYIFEENLSIPLPNKDGWIAKTVDIDHILVKQSATSPIVLPFMCIPKEGNNKIEDKMSPFQDELDEDFALEELFEGGSGEPIYYRQEIMYKREELLKDQIVMNIIRLMDEILKQNNLDLQILTYQVLPTSQNAGLIEIIPRSETIYSIRKRGFTIQNYIFESSQNNSSQINSSQGISMEQRRDNFIRSTAAYCVISYLLGVGDRHLDNIMVSEYGQLFHIDYGFIMGFDPKPLAPYMRITQDILDALGGEQSVHYAQFKEYCTQAYNCLREYTNLFTNMMRILTEDGLNVGKGKFTLHRLEQEISSRFMPGEDDIEAEIQLFAKIDSSHRSYTPQFFIDFFHYHCKEYTLGTAVETITDLPSNITKSIGKYWPFSKS